MKNEKLKEYLEKIYPLLKLNNPEYELNTNDEWDLIPYKVKVIDGHQPFLKETLKDYFIIYKYCSTDGICKYTHKGSDELYQWDYKKQCLKEFNKYIYLKLKTRYDYCLDNNTFTYLDTNYDPVYQYRWDNDNILYRIFPDDGWIIFNKSDIDK